MPTNQDIAPTSSNRHRDPISVLADRYNSLTAEHAQCSAHADEALFYRHLFTDVAEAHIEIVSALLRSIDHTLPADIHTTLLELRGLLAEVLAIHAAPPPITPPPPPPPPLEHVVDTLAAFPNRPQP